MVVCAYREYYAKKIMIKQSQTENETKWRTEKINIRSDEQLFEDIHQASTTSFMQSQLSVCVCLSFSAARFVFKTKNK